MDYKKSGVDIGAGNEAVKRIKKSVESTYNENVLSELGKFGGFFRLNVGEWKEPVLVSSTDGVGTKILVAKMANKFDTIGIDLVNHCVNDIYVHNAKPLFFLDYIGIGKIVPDKIEEIVRGMVVACNVHKMALIGGEMAEMPDIYRDGDTDLVGTIVGCTEMDAVINGESIREDDLVIGFASSGLHTNGYTLARRILFDKLKHDVDDYVEEFGKTVGEELLTPHKSYYPTLSPYTLNNNQDETNKVQINGMAHITGGGIAGNLSRIMPDSLCAEIDCDSWETLPIFSYLGERGGISNREMYSAFNMGIGYIAVVPERSASELKNRCSGIVIGKIKKTDNKDEKVRLLNL